MPYVFSDGQVLMYFVFLSLAGATLDDTFSG